MNSTTRDEAGPLWLLLERFFEWLPIPPWLFLLVILALVVFVVLLMSRRKRS